MLFRTFYSSKKPEKKIYSAVLNKIIKYFFEQQIKILEWFNLIVIIYLICVLYIYIYIYIERERERERGERERERGGGGGGGGGGVFAKTDNSVV